MARLKPGLTRRPRATAALETFGPDEGSGGSQGLVPGPEAGDAGNFLRGDGTWAPISGDGLGDVSGPASSTDEAIARYNGATGKTIQNSVVTINDTGDIAGVVGLAVSNINCSGGAIAGITDLAVADGGTGASTAADARTNLGLGTIATQNANNVTISGGSVSGITDLALADGGTGASLSDPGADRVMAWDDSAGAVKFIPLADFNTEGAPATGDFLLIYRAEGDLRVVDWGDLPGAGGGINNVAEDTTPQLGGDLDLNSFDIQRGGASVVTPAGAVIGYAGTSAPGGWLFCYGQAVSRATYADLFTAIGETYGPGDGVTTFNLPDLRGRAVAGQDDMGGVSANRLTGLTNGVDGDTLGASGGLESFTLAQANLPSFNLDTSSFTGSVGTSLNNGTNVTRNLNTGTDNNNQTGGGGNIVKTASFNSNTLSLVSGAVTFGGTIPSGGSGTAMPHIQPTLILNYIIKI